MAYSLFLALAACGPEGGVAEKVNDNNGLKEILPPPPSAAGTRAEATPAAPPRVTGPLVATVMGTPEHPEIRGTVRFVPSAQGVALETHVDGLPAGPHGYHVHVYGDCSDATAKSPGPHLDFASLGNDGRAAGGASPPGHVVHPEQPKAQADGQLVSPNSPNPNAAPTNSRPETATRGTGMGSGDASATRGSPGTRESAANSSAGSTTHPGGAPSPTASAPGGTTGGAAGTAITPVAGEPGTTHATHPGSAGDMVLGNLGELVGAKGQPATARASLESLVGVDLQGLVGRAVVIHEHANDPTTPDGAAGNPIACGVIGLANPAPADTRTGSSGPGRESKQQGAP